MATKPDADTLRLRSVLDAAGMGTDLSRFVRLVGEALREVRPVERHRGGPADLAARDVAELRGIGFEPGAASADAHRTVTERTVAKMTALLADSQSVEQVAERLGVHPSRVRQMLGDRSLYGLKTGSEWRIPSFQFAGDHLVGNLGPVIRATPENLHPIALQNWFTRVDRALSIDDTAVSPRDWLESGGDPARAAEIAAEL